MIYALLIGTVISSSLLAADEPSAPPNQEVYHIILDPIERTKLSTRLSTPITKISKRLGDSFSKGDELIRLEDRIPLGMLEKAKAMVDKSETELAAKQALYKDNAASLYELKDAAFNLAYAKSELAASQETVEATRIIAPYDGKIANLYFEEGELPKTGDVLVELINDKTLVARFLVNSKISPKIGQQININLVESGDTIAAKITRIGADIDPSSGTVKVEAEIDNKNAKLTAGMSGDAYFTEESKK